jgi:ribonuclease HII
LRSASVARKRRKSNRLNVYWAAMEARRRAVETLPKISAHVLVDGKRRIAHCRILQRPVVDGDALCASIAAASIVAKVLRDSLMTQHPQIAPQQWFRMAQAVSTPITSMRSVGSVHCHSIAFYSRCAASG